MNIIPFLVSQLHNQFVGGGLVLMLTGSVLALLRATPKKIYEWAKRRVTVEVEVLNSDPLFDYVSIWLHEQPYSRRSRRLTATTSSRVNFGKSDEDDDDQPVAPGGVRESKKLRVFLTPAPGQHVFLYKGRVLWLDRTRENQAPATAGHGKVSVGLKSETYTITMLGRNQTVVRSLIEDITSVGDRPRDYVRLFSCSWGYWESRGIFRPRKLDSVVLPAGMAEAVLDDARQFLSSADWYHRVGIPWHRGYLLSGLPGSGKTSLVAALAGELGMDLYLLSLSGMDDERLSGLMSGVRAGTMVLMEDIDCTAPTRETKDVARVTLSGLLNCIDGIQSREGVLIFMTTNFPEKLDAALTRPGRIDISVEFTTATDEQILRLRDRLNPEAESGDLLAECRGKSMADVQKILLGNGQPKVLTAV